MLRPKRVCTIPLEVMNRAPKTLKNSPLWSTSSQKILGKWRIPEMLTVSDICCLCLLIVRHSKMAYTMSMARQSAAAPSPIQNTIRKSPVMLNIWGVTRLLIPAPTRFEPV
eukprot:TRINITY_DN1774_c0_g1_i10.p4 TRINITY_DN1774_c0_g1~~TRINITY_DN1774_c0_g1_i10.p4  ORF type:complete len:111 (+),score=20.68 TRINITY_DN1774_c0_g1_i10:573-905(+)